MASAGGYSGSMSASGPSKTAGLEDHQTLVQGDKLSLRKWVVKAGDRADDPACNRNYVSNHDAVLYCTQGEAELHMEGSTLLLRPADSWTVPKGAPHTYKVLSRDTPFVAIEACHPVAP